MSVPNPRDKKAVWRPVQCEGNGGFAGSVLGFVICFVLVVMLGLATFSKTNSIYAPAQKPANISSIPSKTAPAENGRRVDKVEEENILRQSLSEWDGVINATTQRIESYREPETHLVAEMQALQQSMDRLQAIGDQKGRNELVYQFNDRSHRYNSINAEKGRLVSYLNDLINGRNKIASDLNTLQRQR